jgi:hypothetical protein
MSEIAGKLVPFKLSFDGGTTKKSGVCLQNFEDSLDIPIDEQETDCGKITSPGAPGATFTATLVVKKNPAVGEFSLQDCREAAANGDSVIVYIESPADAALSLTAGEVYYSSYTAYFSNVTVTKETTRSLAFNLTLNSTGAITVVAP